MSRSRRSSPGEVEILTRLSDWPMDWQSSGEVERFIWKATRFWLCCKRGKIEKGI